MKKSILFFLGLLIMGAMQAQIRAVPAVVKSTIEHHYPDAKNITYEDYLTRYRVHFTQEKDSITVAISNSGSIKSVSRRLNIKDLPGAVHLGFEKSKFADWNIATVDKLEEPGADTQYVLGADGGTIFQKRNLYFSESGQLLKDKRAL